MRKLLLVVLFSKSIVASAQQFQGKAEYFSKFIFNKGNEKVEVQSEEEAAISKTVEEALKKASEKVFLLTFNKKESLYEEQQNLEKPDVQNGSLSISVSLSGQGKKYVNIKDKSMISEDEIFGKEFLIVEKLTPIEWLLLDESKKIGEYTCYKAEVTLPVTEKQLQEYQDYLKRQAIKPSLFQMEEPKPQKVTAWYTPEIPVSFGPLNYWGLPGLILELNDQHNIILCSKVTLSNKENVKIKVPNKGAKISQKEFDAIQKAKMDSMKDEDGNIIFQTQK